MKGFQCYRISNVVFVNSGCYNLAILTEILVERIQYTKYKFAHESSLMIANFGGGAKTKHDVDSYGSPL